MGGGCCLQLASCSDVVLDSVVSDNDISDEGASALTGALQVNQSLQTLK